MPRALPAACEEKEVETVTMGELAAASLHLLPRAPLARCEKGIDRATMGVQDQGAAESGEAASSHRQIVRPGSTAWVEAFC